ncbi:hypothetical protein ISN44_As09g009050 [Arabidopsis suecica]|uniref:Uncharacterized protein n=1 Tax=Arabidopsis suecica TaxID=45249 RepID=A0A8T2AGD3_ARASU|nr:hypothetical protein ISN44_As09g009050 [Arabidopsis suecica]
MSLGRRNAKLAKTDDPRTMRNRSAASDGPSGTMHVRPADVCSACAGVCSDRADVCMVREDVCSDCEGRVLGPRRRVLGPCGRVLCSVSVQGSATPAACLLHQKLLGVATGSGDSATHVASGGMISGEVVVQQLRNRLSNPI